MNPHSVTPILYCGVDRVVKTAVPYVPVVCACGATHYLTEERPKATCGQCGKIVKLANVEKVRAK